MKKIEFKNKIISGVLALCMVVGVLPMANTTVYAADTGTAPLPTMAMGMNGIQNVDKGTDEDSVTNSDQIVMGTYGGNPVYWVMLGDSPVGSGESYIINGTGKMMFAVRSLGESVFEDGTFGYYPNSTLNESMATLFNDSLTSTEKSAVLGTTLTASSMGDGNERIPVGTINDLAGQHFFPISTQEFNSSVEKSSTLAKDNFTASWWLRSSETNYNAAAFFTSSGIFSYNGLSVPGGVRPAFNLNLSSVLFTSAAVGGKTSFDGEAAPIVGEISGTAPTTWKMTLLDNTRSGFSVTGTPTISGNEVTFSYTGATPYNATTALNEYISVMITTGTAPNETITHYAKVARPTSASGTAKFTLPNTFNAGDTVNIKIFSEQANGDYKTDYSSAFEEFTVTIPKAVNNLDSVTQSNVPYGTAVSPTVTYSGGASATNGGAVGLEYKEQGAEDSTYTTTAPQYIGDYTVRATSATTATVAQGTQTDDFSITAIDQTPTITTTTNVGAGNSIDLSTLVANAQGTVSFTKVSGDGTLTGSSYTASNTAGTAVFTVDITAIDENNDSVNEYNAYTGINGITVNITAAPTVTPTPNTGNTSPAKYNLVVNYGSGDGDYTAGTWITITAENRTGYTFSHWASNEVTFENANSQTTRFIMNNKNVEVTAVYNLNNATALVPEKEDVSSEEIPNPDVPLSPEPEESKVPIVEENLENEETSADDEGSMLPILGIGVAIAIVVGFIISRKRNKSE